MRTLAALLFAGTQALAADPTCPPRDMWPTPDWPSSTSTATASAEATAAVAALDAYAFTLVGEDRERLGIRTDAVVILKGGEVIYERYARGFNAASKHLTWSVSKSLTNVLTGVAVKQGMLSMSDSICRTIPELPASACPVKVEDLLHMASGLDWLENYEDAGSNQQSSVLALLYGQGARDMGTFNARHAVRDAPGTSWLYSTGDTMTLSLVLQRAMAGRFGERFPWPTLFDQIGATRVTLERDAVSTFGGGSYWYSSARDAARLGFLLLNDGCWNGTRLLPEGWVQQSVVPNPAFIQKRLDARPTDVYGRLLWLNRAVPEAGIPKPWPALPDDFYAARGHWGQSISVVPSQDLVLVRFADDRDEDAFDVGRFHALALAVAAAAPSTTAATATTTTTTTTTATTTEQP